MPYIKREDRERLGKDPHPQNAGELNYAVTVFINEYLRDHGLSYQVCNDIVGALDGAKTEFQRRVLGPYEDMKMRTNGDAYDYGKTRGDRDRRQDNGAVDSSGDGDLEQEG